MKTNTAALAVLALASALTCGSALAQQQGVTKTEILIGTIQDLSGPLAGYGKAARNGMLLRIDEVNEQGGVHGRKLRLVAEDDGYDPKKALLAAQKLVNLGARVVTGDLNDRASVERATEGVDAIFAMGTPFEAGIEAEIRQGSTVAEAARPGASTWSKIRSRRPTRTPTFPTLRANGRSSSTSPGLGQKLPSLRPSTSWKIS